MPPPTPRNYGPSRTQCGSGDTTSVAASLPFAQTIEVSRIFWNKLSKLLGYRFSIVYKKGMENGAADSLSRLPTADAMTHQLRAMLTLEIPDWVEQLRMENRTNGWLLGIQQQICQGTTKPGFEIVDGLVLFKTRFDPGPSSTLRETIINKLHGTRMDRHSGVYHTLARVHLRFFWLGMSCDIRDFISSSLTFQQVKLISAKAGGLLQPLPIPTSIWEDISMDFVTGFPTVAGKSIIIVVVDRLSKYYHLGTLPPNYTATMVAEYFTQQIV